MTVICLSVQLSLPHKYLLSCFIFMCYLLYSICVYLYLLYLFKRENFELVLINSKDKQWTFSTFICVLLIRVVVIDRFSFIFSCSEFGRVCFLLKWSHNLQLINLKNRNTLARLKSNGKKIKSIKFPYTYHCI